MLPSLNKVATTTTTIVSVQSDWFLVLRAVRNPEAIQDKGSWDTYPHPSSPMLQPRSQGIGNDVVNVAFGFQQKGEKSVDKQHFKSEGRGELAWVPTLLYQETM